MLVALVGCGSGEQAQIRHEAPIERSPLEPETFVDVAARPAATSEAEPPEAKPASLPATTFTPFVVGGELSRDFAATGMLLTADGQCTATLVAADMILTAAHCVYDSLPAEAEFIIGVDENSRARSVTLAQIDVHPAFDLDALVEAGHDLAVARLSEPIDEVAPVVLYLDDAHALIGERMRLTGYGSEGVDPNTLLDVGGGVRRSASVTLAGVSPETLDYDVLGMGACHGDSGGPAFVKLGNSYVQVGVNSWGDSECNMIGRFQRIDIYRNWLVGLGVPVGSRSVSCVEDQSCDGQCEVDRDCLALLCPWGSCTAPPGRCAADQRCDDTCGSSDPDCNVGDPDEDPCEAYGLNDNGICNPQCPDDFDCAPTDPAPGSCAMASAVPGSDGFCYYLSDQNEVCTTVPLQAIYYDDSSTLCMYFDADGQSCGSTQASVYLDEERQCVYVDPDGLECGRRWATCTFDECYC